MRMTRGFAVLPLLITLATLMTAGTVAVALLASSDLPGRRERDSAALQVIEHALAGFLAAHGRLPCPDTSDPQDGWEDCGRPGAWLSNGPAGVPFRTLGLSSVEAAGFRYVPAAVAALPELDAAVREPLDDLFPAVGLPPSLLTAWLGKLPGARPPSFAESVGGASHGLVAACNRLESLRVRPERSLGVASSAWGERFAAYVLIGRSRPVRSDKWFENATISGHWPEQVAYIVKENRVEAMTVRRLEAELACLPLLQSRQSLANALAEADLLYRHAARQAAPATRTEGEDQGSARIVQGLRHYGAAVGAVLETLAGRGSPGALGAPGQGNPSKDEIETDT